MILFMLGYYWVGIQLAEYTFVFYREVFWMDKAQVLQKGGYRDAVWAGYKIVENSVLQV